MTDRVLWWLNRHYLRVRRATFAWLARELEPHLSQGVHVDGLTINADSGVTVQGMTVRGSGERPGIQILGPPIP